MVGRFLVSFALLATFVGAYQVNKSSPKLHKEDGISSRRDLLRQALAATASVALLGQSQPVWASGGATAGKYTYVTISYA